MKYFIFLLITLFPISMYGQDLSKQNRNSIGFVSSISSAPFGVHYSLDFDNTYGLFVEAKISDKFFTRNTTDAPGAGYKDFMDYDAVVVNAGLQLSVVNNLYWYGGIGFSSGNLFRMGLPQDDGTYTWSKTDDSVHNFNLTSGLKFYLSQIFILTGCDLTFINQRDYDFGYRNGYSNTAHKYSLNLGIGYTF